MLKSHQKLLKLINEFSEESGYKINMHKSVVFLFTNNELSERETKKPKLYTILHTHTHTHKIKYLGINLTEDVTDLYSENYKTLRKGIEENIHKWEHIPCSGIERNNTIKMSILP